MSPWRPIADTNSTCSDWAAPGHSTAGEQDLLLIHLLAEETSEVCLLDYILHGAIPPYSVC